MRLNPAWAAERFQTHNDDQAANYFIDGLD
jgi:hypothetical protein